MDYTGKLVHYFSVYKVPMSCLASSFVNQYLLESLSLLLSAEHLAYHFQRVYDKSYHSRSRSKSLRDILVHSQLVPQRSVRERGGSKKCQRNCTMCVYSIASRTHDIPHSNTKHAITSEVNCQSSNVIYKLTCAKCNKFLYIGETSRRACSRFQEHRGYINQRVTSQPSGLHFTSIGHTLADIRIQVIEQVRPHDDFIRKARESYWISQYRATTKGNNLRK